MAEAYVDSVLELDTLSAMSDFSPHATPTGGESRPTKEKSPSGEPVPPAVKQRGGKGKGKKTLHWNECKYPREMPLIYQLYSAKR